MGQRASRLVGHVSLTVGFGLVVTGVAGWSWQAACVVAGVGLFWGGGVLLAGEERGAP